MPVTRVTSATTWLLGHANARAQRLLADGFAAFGLRPLHYRALAALDEHGELSQAELGRHLSLDRKDVTVALDSLAQRGLVERTPDATDRRRNVVALTDAGRELLPQLDRALESVQARVLAPFTEREAGQLRAMLAKLIVVDAEMDSSGDGKGPAQR
jgi:DNA-binding MarR family transcriptional regulator